MSKSNNAAAGILILITALAAVVYYFSSEVKALLGMDKKPPIPTPQEVATAQQAAASATGKTIVESNDNGSLTGISTMGGAAFITGAAGATVGKVGLTATKAALGTGAKLASKAFLPLTVGIAAYDTVQLYNGYQEQGSLSVGEVLGQYSGLEGLGIGERLPDSIRGVLDWRW